MAKPTRPGWVKYVWDNGGNWWGVGGNLWSVGGNWWGVGGN